VTHLEDQTWTAIAGAAVITALVLAVVLVMI
jgi:hypothetical protein